MSSGKHVSSQKTFSTAYITTLIGSGQILSWGTSYYILPVLALPISEDTGWDREWLFLSLSLGLVVSGIASPWIGRLIQRRGGRPILAASSVLLATGLVALALAPTLPTFAAAWGLIGLGMGAGLYDPAFSTLGRLYGQNARPLISRVTLFGGFASTLSWPATAFLALAFGWRSACFVYAAIHLTIMLPLYLYALPRETAAIPASTGTGLAPGASLRPGQRVPFFLLAVAFTLGYGIMTVVAVHLLAFLQAGGTSLATAVALGGLFGPSQVGARVLEMRFGQKLHPVWVLLVSALAITAGTGVLALVPGWSAAGIVLYGIGSGLRSITRGTVPLALFGHATYPILMGHLAVPALLATAAGPTLGIWLIEAMGAKSAMLLLAAASAANLALALPLLRYIRPQTHAAANGAA